VPANCTRFLWLDSLSNWVSSNNPHGGEAGLLTTRGRPYQRFRLGDHPKTLGKAPNYEAFARLKGIIRNAGIFANNRIGIGRATKLWVRKEVV
jgi:hypothetical protein